MNEKSEEEKKGSAHDDRVNEPVIGSGVAHSVVTNVRTRNAINPHNTFLTTSDEPPQLATDAPLLTPRAHSSPNLNANSAETDLYMAQDQTQPIGPVDALTAHDPLTTAKTPLSSNMQRMPIEAVVDQQKFLEALTKLEEKLHQIKAKQEPLNRQAVGSSSFSDNFQPAEGGLHIRDNWQSLGKSHALDDNRQRSGDGPLTDTRAPLDEGRRIEKRSVYLEKKNIHDNVQFVHEPSSQDRATSTPSHEGLSQQSAWADDVLNGLDADASVVRDLLAADLGAFNEDELRARLRAVKERLRVANQSLRNAEAENEKINPNEPWSDPT